MLTVRAGGSVVAGVELGEQHATVALFDRRAEVVVSTVAQVSLLDGVESVVGQVWESARELAKANGGLTLEGIAMSLPGPVDSRTSRLLADADAGMERRRRRRGARLRHGAAVPDRQRRERDGRRGVHRARRRAGAAGLREGGQRHRLRHHPGGRGLPRVPGRRRRHQPRRPAQRAADHLLVRSGRLPRRGRQWRSDRRRAQGGGSRGRDPRRRARPRAGCSPQGHLRAARGRRAYGEVLATIINFFNPQALALGGRLATADAFVAGVRQALFTLCLPMSTDALEIGVSRAGALAGARGVAWELLERMLDPARIDEELRTAAA
ncbi:hypothetical protein [Microbacterium sp. Se63.02b]|uniref:ROK family protein n=1 Tax=Microbacterium sp. Se63.02b TaxID=2709304 RepID=UPI001FCF02F3|nr:hypothetical protein [Microbacterium sp. Se63.02b]